jgi:large repetitive protein
MIPIRHFSFVAWLLTGLACSGHHLLVGKNSTDGGQGGSIDGSTAIGTGGMGTGGANATGGTPGTGGQSSSGARITISFTASPATVFPGGSSTLRWTVTHATTMVIDQGIGPVTSPGSVVVKPGKTTTYTLTASNPGEEANASQVVSVDGLGSFSPAGKMSTQRALHTGTLLPSGEVLIAGGYGDSSTRTLANAELYDPNNNSFRPTGDMRSPRNYHTATLLPNGKVLIAGGNSGAGSLATAELYDPATGIFTVTGSLAAPRETHTALLLQSGKVLIIGGGPNITGLVGPLSTPVATAELYDPGSGSFSATGSMAEPRAMLAATLLANGEILAVGGSFDELLPVPHLTGAELYAPDRATFLRTSSMPTVERDGAKAALLANGNVLLVGGSAGDPNLGWDLASTEEIYDPTSDTFTATGPLHDMRTYHAICVLENGRVLIVGGGGVSKPLSSAELYDPASGTMTVAGSLLQPRIGHTATGLPGRKVLIAGGYDRAADTAELYTY